MLKIKLSKWDPRSSENWKEMFSKRNRELFKMECKKFVNWDQEDLELQNEGRKMR